VVTQERKWRIARLLDRVEEAVHSEANQARLKREPKAVFQLEEPIASSILWGYDVNDYISDPYLYVEQTLTTRLWRWESFPDDDAPITLDLAAWLGHYPEYTYAGMDVAFTPRGVPTLQTDHPLSRDPDLRLLHPVDFYTSGWMPRVLRWYDDLRGIVGGRLNVTFNMTWWRGCLDLAIQLRGYDQFIGDTAERPEFVHDLLRFLTEQRCRWYEAYYRHYGLPVGPTAVADDWINVPFISPRIFSEFVLPRYQEIERFHGGIAGIHSCGNQAPVQRYMLQLETLPGLEVSPWTDLQQSLRNIPPSKRLFIALHPNDVLCATPEEMDARLREITTSCQGRSYGIGTSGLTPIWDDPQEYVQRIRTWTGIVQRVMAPLRTP
jgi:uroporphyrinogen-III decarboxylase